jgi:hypothetical protein
VKKRGQLNTAFKQRYFVLKDEMLKYYEDKKAYLTNKRGGLKGSTSTKNITVTPATPKGLKLSKDGYHFTVTTGTMQALDQKKLYKHGKVIECACESVVERDMWVHKLQESQRNAEIVAAKFTAASSSIEQVQHAQGPHIQVLYNADVQLAETVNRSVIDNDPHHQPYQRRDIVRTGQKSPSVPIMFESVVNDCDQEGETSVASDHLSQNSVYTISLGQTASHPASSTWPSLR